MPSWTYFLKQKLDTVSAIRPLALLVLLLPPLLVVGQVVPFTQAGFHKGKQTHLELTAGVGMSKGQPRLLRQLLLLQSPSYQLREEALPLEDGNINFGLNLNGLLYHQLQLNSNNGLRVGMRYERYLSSRLPLKAMRLVFVGNKDIDTFSLEDKQLADVDYYTAALTWVHEINSRWSFSIGAAYHTLNKHRIYDFQEFSYGRSLDRTQITAQGDITIKEANRDVNTYRFSGGSGGSLLLGLAYTSEKYSFQGWAEDLGFIYTVTEVSRQSGGESGGSLRAIDLFEAGNSYSSPTALLDSFAGAGTADTSAYTITLPWRVGVSLAYQASEHLSFKGEAQYIKLPHRLPLIHGTVNYHLLPKVVGIGGFLAGGNSAGGSILGLGYSSQAFEAAIISYYPESYIVKGAEGSGINLSFSWKY